MHYHFRFQRLVYYVGVSSSAEASVRDAFHRFVAASARADVRNIGLLRLLLDLAAVGGDGSLLLGGRLLDLRTRGLGGAAAGRLVEGVHFV